MNNTRCLLFDLDGTLLDSREPIVDAVYATVQKYQPGMFAREDLLRCFGESFDDFFRRISPELPSGVTREQFFITYLDYMNVYHGKKLKLFPFVCEGLEDLKLLGYQLGIVTNKQRELVLEGLQSVNILNLFDTVVTLDDVTMGKPSPEPIVKAMDFLGVKPDETIMVGDSRYDVLAARAARVKSVILEWYGQEKWQEPLPDYRFPNFHKFSEKILHVNRICELRARTRQT